MEQMTSPGAKTSHAAHAPLGTFGHARKLITPQDTLIVTPNNDTMYSSAWIELSKEPYVLHIPEITDKRYYSFSLLDAWTNVFALLSSRTRGFHEGTYVIVGPHWHGTVPDKLEKIVAPTDLVWILVRTLVRGQEDVPQVAHLQDQYGITPLSAYIKTKSWPAIPANPTSRYSENKEIAQELQFFDRIGFYLKGTAAKPEEQALRSWFSAIGIGPDGLTLDKIDPATAAGLSRVKLASEQILQDQISKNNKKIYGWTIPDIPQGFGNDYLLRAAITYKGFAALPASESLYCLAEQDSHGNSLYGTYRYLLHFEKDQLPPADAFWSITMYSQKTFNLVDNPINRYSIGDRTPGIAYNNDGSLDMYIQHAQPSEHTSNWLPAPADDFFVVLRLYNPKKAVLNGAWKIPGINRQS
jgi:hypothetical protein